MTAALPSTSLHRRTAVVTGAAGGIGRAIVAALMAQGARVHGLDRDADALAALHAEFPGDFAGHAVDLADRQETDRCLDTLKGALRGRCDILVNNAGISRVTSFDDTDDALLDALFAVNFHASFRITRALLPLLAASPAPSVVNIGSELALVGQPGYSAYSATKGAVLAWTRALAVELAPRRVRVNAICPGPVDTPMLDAEFALAADPVAARRAEAAAVPVGRLGRPQDIAAAVAFLASDAGGYVNGAAWVVDGGKTVQ